MFTPAPPSYDSCVKVQPVPAPKEPPLPLKLAKEYPVAVSFGVCAGASMATGVGLVACGLKGVAPSPVSEIVGIFGTPILSGLGVIGSTIASIYKR